MTKYIENLNLYLDARKIKQTYLSMKTGIDAKKMSRILNGVQDITGTDMEKYLLLWVRIRNIFTGSVSSSANV